MNDRPVIPPRYVNTEINVIFSDIAPAAVHTYSQLKALAWQNDGKVTIPFSYPLLAQLTGKSQATLYGHIALLKKRNVLRCVSSGQGNFVVEFTEALLGEVDDSRNLKNLVNDLSLSFKELKEGEVDKSVPISENPEHDADFYRKRSEDALWHGILSHAGMPEGLEDYPEDVREPIAEVCKLWKLHPPRRSNRTASPYAYWIQSARDLIDACGELGLEAIQAEREDFVTHMQKHQGLAPYRVEGPASLIKSVRAKAGEIRQKRAFVNEVIPPPAAAEW